MLIAVVGLATILMIVWLVLLGMVSKEDWVAAATNKVLDNRQEIDKLRMKDVAANPKHIKWLNLSDRHGEEH